MNLWHLLVHLYSWNYGISPSEPSGATLLRRSRALNPSAAASGAAERAERAAPRGGRGRNWGTLTRKVRGMGPWILQGGAPVR